MKIEQSKDRYLQMLITAFGEDIMRFMDDEDIIEIMLNPDGNLVIDKLYEGKIITDIRISKEQGESLVKLVASYKNAVIDVMQPMIAADLPFSGARFQGWLPPVVTNPVFAIRKRAIRIFTLDDYVKAGTLKASEADYLKQAVASHKNIIIAGGTTSGKTTFANALLNELAGTDDRILILEDLPELQVNVDDAVSMMTTPTVSMRDLVKGAMRMRPDRIIIGEVRDGAALDLLKAWNTGHPGGICTVHANSANSTLFRIEDLIREVVVTVPRSLILEAIDVIVYIQRDKSGKRCIRSVSKLNGFENGEYLVE